MLVTSTSCTSNHLTTWTDSRRPSYHCYRENVSTNPKLDDASQPDAEPCQTKRPCTKPILDLRGRSEFPDKWNRAVLSRSPGIPWVSY